MIRSIVNVFFLSRTALELEVATVVLCPALEVQFFPACCAYALCDSKCAVP